MAVSDFTAIRFETLTDVLLPYPGVSTKHKFLSSTESPKLFLLRRILLSSKSDHQAGYARVLAYTSVICEVVCTSALPDLDFVLEFFRLGSGIEIDVGNKGST